MDLTLSITAFSPSLPIAAPRNSSLPSRRLSLSNRSPQRRARLAGTATCVSSIASRAGIAAGLSTVAESPEPVPLRVVGELPKWLRGTLDRVGPGTFEAPAADGSLVRMTHWFDGLPHLHRFQFHSDGLVTYKSKHVGRHVESAIASCRTSNDFKSIMIGTVLESGNNLFGLLAAVFAPKGGGGGLPNAPLFPIGVVVERNTIPGKCLAITTDAPAILTVDEESLEPQHVLSYKDAGVSGGQLATAHRIYDAEEAVYYSLLGQLVRPRGDIRIVRFSSEPDSASVFSTIKNVPATYIHSFAMTATYFVVVVNSSRVDGLKVVKTGSFLGGSSFAAEEPTKLHVVARATGKHIGTYEALPSFNFHIVNAFDFVEEGGGASVCLDICRYPDMEIFGAMTVDNMIRGPTHEETPKATLTRYTLRNIDSMDQKSSKPSKAEERTLSPKNCDLPYINDAFRGRGDYRFMYGVSHESGDWFSGVSKVDIQTGSSVAYGPPGCHLSEPVFVADPTADPADEDAGVVLLVEIDSSEPTQSSLVVLDAKSMSEMARCEVNCVVPFSFHGDFCFESAIG